MKAFASHEAEMAQVRKALLTVVPARKDRALMARCPRCGGVVPPGWRDKVKAVLTKRLF